MRNLIISFLRDELQSFIAKYDLLFVNIINERSNFNQLGAVLMESGPGLIESRGRYKVESKNQTCLLTVLYKTNRIEKDEIIEIANNIIDDMESHFINKINRRYTKETKTIHIKEMLWIGSHEVAYGNNNDFIINIEININYFIN